jgi:hypothetical protein
MKYQVTCIKFGIFGAAIFFFETAKFIDINTVQEVPGQEYKYINKHRELHTGNCISGTHQNKTPPTNTN